MGVKDDRFSLSEMIKLMTEGQRKHNKLTRKASGNIERITLSVSDAVAEALQQQACVSMVVIRYAY